MAKPSRTISALPVSIQDATRAYETWLGTQMLLLPADLKLKHQRMTESSFAFLRATFYRWSQLFPEVCPELVEAPVVLGVCDLHVENFGTWRDCEGRLIWGVNDFDEACGVAYTNDLVRLCVSAQLAVEEHSLSCDLESICDAVLTGYIEALEESGTPFVLAESHKWLRDVATSDLRDPVRFWTKLQQWRDVSKAVPGKVERALKRTLPEPNLSFRVVHRQAGLGSLGRRRFTALAEWRGGLIAREAKELCCSGWLWARGRRNKAKPLYDRILEQSVRVPDPFVQLHGNWIVRRLAPDCSRIELGSLAKFQEELKLLRAMGWETANIHLGTKRCAKTILKHVRRQPGTWLVKAVSAMTKATVEDWKSWRSEAGT